MFKNYLLTAFKVYARRKVFTAINLACIVLTLVVLMVVAALLQNAFQFADSEVHATVGWDGSETWIVVRDDDAGWDDAGQLALRKSGGPFPL